MNLLQRLVNDIPVAIVPISRRNRQLDMRIFGYSDIEPRLVEIRCELLHRTLHLTCEQAEQIAAGLLTAVEKARA